MRKTILKTLGVVALAAVLTASVTAPVQAAVIEKPSPAATSVVPVTPALGY